jgi:hypothetical protein
MEVFGIGSLLLISGILLSMAVRIVPPYTRLIVFRLGRSRGSRGPGPVLLIPFVDRGITVDMREVFFDVPPQTCITADNASVSIDFLVYDKVIDPERSVLEVEDFTGRTSRRSSAGSGRTGASSRHASAWTTEPSSPLARSATGPTGTASPWTSVARGNQWTTPSSNRSMGA